MRGGGGGGGGALREGDVKGLYKEIEAGEAGGEKREVWGGGGIGSSWLQERD